MDEISQAFCKRYLQHPAPKAYWRGRFAGKSPLDLWVYQEIIAEIRPEVIIECGTNQGGSALFFADVCELVGNGHVYSVDVVPPPALAHPRLTFLQGSSTDSAVVGRLRAMIGSQAPVMVSLDSLHHQTHVARELELYSPFVTVGSYLVVEDTVINGHPAKPEFGPGPFEALRDFVHGTECFRTDLSREKFLYTQNPFGWVKRVK